MRLSKDWPAWSPRTVAPQLVEDATQHPRFKYFREAGEDPYHVVPRRAADRSRPAPGRPGGADRRAARVHAGRRADARPRPARSWPRSSAKRARWGSSWRRRIGVWRRWPRICGGAGMRKRRAFSAISTRCCGATSGTTRSRCSSRFSVDKLEDRAAQLAPPRPHQLHLPAAAGISRSRRRPGARAHAGVLWARPVAYFSAEFGLHESLPIYSGGLGILAGDHIKSASDLGHSARRRRAVLRPGLLPAAAGSGRLPARGVPTRSTARMLPIEPATMADGEPVTVTIETRTGTIAARVWTRHRRP